jgi:hypothetical protein
MQIARRFLLTAITAVTFAAASISAVEAATRWEYKTIQLDKVNVTNPQQLELLLNQLGQEGWLLIETSAAGVAIFRREK